MAFHLKIVDNFLGDSHKRAFDLAVYTNQISKNVLGLDPITDGIKPMDICEIRNVKNIPDQYPDVHFLKNQKSVIKKSSKN